jgi:hypothetical protein
MTFLLVILHTWHHVRGHPLLLELVAGTISFVGDSLSKQCQVGDRGHSNDRHCWLNGTAAYRFHIGKPCDFDEPQGVATSSYSAANCRRSWMRFGPSTSPAHFAQIATPRAASYVRRNRSCLRGDSGASLRRGRFGKVVLRPLQTPGASFKGCMRRIWRDACRRS